MDDPERPGEGAVPPPRRAGRPRRGALTNRTGRFERRAIELDPAAGTGEPAPAATVVSEDRSRTVIARNDSPDLGFDRSLNPYRGCEHGCSYCFARPSHAYLGLSPGLDFETRIVVKPEAAARLREELSRPGYRPAVLALGSNTDPYQPLERRLNITRAVLETLREFRHPVAIVTKSSLVLRDLDLLAPMAAARLAAVCVSLTTLDPELAGRMEPRAASPGRRLATIRELAAAGVPVTLLASPMIPGLNDHELERILEAGAGAGASHAGYILLRLPGELARIFPEWLEAHYPGRARHVLSLIRQTRQGRMNDPNFGSRMRGAGPLADLLERRFRVAARRLGLAAGDRDLDTEQFRVPRAQAGPPPPGGGPQGELFR